MNNATSEKEKERIWGILQMFHGHHTSFCGVFSELKGNKFVYRPECKLMEDTFNLIVSGKTANEWWQKKFKGDFQKWNAWKIKRNIIKGENK